MAHSMFDSRAVFLLAAFAYACGGSSANAGAGGTGPGTAQAGASSSAGTSPGGTSGSGSAGAGNVAGVSNGGAGIVAGASNGGSTCAAITPCGGDLVGTWMIQDVCLSATALDTGSAACSGATFNLTPFSATGSISFKADNTMVSSAVISFHETVNYPPSCYTEAQCTAFVDLLSTQASVSNAHCSYDAGTGCSCSLDSTQPSMSSGTYQIQGSNVTIMTTGSDKVGVDEFCVSGDTLRLFQRNSNGLAASMILTR